MSKEYIKAALAAHGMRYRESAGGRIIATAYYTTRNGSSGAIDTDVTDYTKARLLWWLGY